jgi:hypothetical protein
MIYDLKHPMRSDETAVLFLRRYSAATAVGLLSFAE